MKSTNQKLAELVRAAIKELDPARLIEKRHIGNIGKFKRVYIVAIGKAAGVPKGSGGGGVNAVIVIGLDFAGT